MLKTVRILPFLTCVLLLLPGRTVCATCAAQQRIFLPDRMICSGDVVTGQNSVNLSTHDWMRSMPAGGIILGVKPASRDPHEWKGGKATLEFSVRNESLPIVCMVRVSWPDRDGKGIHSIYKNRVVSIQLDGQIIWSKRTEIPGKTNGDFYAAEHEPIQTTVVVRDTMSHSLSFIVPDNTAWDIGGVEILYLEYPRQMKGIGYSPYRDCQVPGAKTGPQTTIENLREDILRLSHTCTAIRTYSATGMNGMIPAIAKSLGMQVYAGAWIDGDNDDKKTDDEEIDAVIALANTVNIDGVIVGNEYFQRHQKDDGASDYLRNAIRRVKNGIIDKRIRITTAECKLSSIEKNKAVLDDLDGILIHLYPFWGGQSINEAVKSVIDGVLCFRDSLQKWYPWENKFVIVGETGWPSFGESTGGAIPSAENQRRYLSEFLRKAETQRIDFMYFDAFDELWKTEEGRRGQHWGYAYSDRSAKYNFNGVLIPSAVIPDATIDLPPNPPQQDFPESTFTISSDWPQNSKSFKITQFSIREIKKKFPKHTPIAELNALIGREFDTGEALIEAFRRAQYGKGDLGKNVQTQAWKHEYSAGHSVDYKGLENCIIKNSQYHYFMPRFMGDVSSILMNECDRCDAATGELSTKISFSFTGKRGWCGIYWLPMIDFESEIPESDAATWEELPGVNILNKIHAGSDQAVLLTFWCRGELGGEQVNFKFDGINTGGPSIETETVTLHKEWHRYAINLTGGDLGNVIGAFACIAGKDQNPRKKGIQFYLDCIRFEFAKNEFQLLKIRSSNILDSDYHLIEFFGDVTSRSSNFYEVDYNGGVFSGEIRVIFPRFSKLFGTDMQLPEIYWSANVKSLKGIDWEDRVDYGIGVEWRPLTTLAFPENSMLTWVKELRLYGIVYGTEFMQYQKSWSWRPTSDARVGIDLYKETQLYSADVVWSEVWADVSWRNTNFYVNGYKSWLAAIVPKVGIKFFPQTEFCLMPYMIGEFVSTQRSEFWQNRLLAGGGIRVMPFRWNESLLRVLCKGVRMYVEALWAVKYFRDAPPPSYPTYDVRAGITYTLNWW